MTEDALLKEIAAGNEEAFRQFYLCTVRPVHSYILSLTRNSHEAEDVLQETYLKIWTDAGQYRPQGKPLAWVFTIARNLCYMRFREQRRWAEFGLSELEDCEEGKNCEQIDQAADRQVLLRALDELKEQDRQIVLLYAAAGMKHREVAKALGLPLATELSRYSRSMKRLQQLLTVRRTGG